jgi:hypothetical protein
VTNHFKETGMQPIMYDANISSPTEMVSVLESPDKVTKGSSLRTPPDFCLPYFSALTLMIPFE